MEYTIIAMAVATGGAHQTAGFVQDTIGNLRRSFGNDAEIQTAYCAPDQIDETFDWLGDLVEDTILARFHPDRVKGAAEAEQDDSETPPQESPAYPVDDDGNPDWPELTKKQILAIAEEYGIGVGVGMKVDELRSFVSGVYETLPDADE